MGLNMRTFRQLQLISPVLSNATNYLDACKVIVYVGQRRAKNHDIVIHDLRDATMDLTACQADRTVMSRGR